MLCGDWFTIRCSVLLRLSTVLIDIVSGLRMSIQTLLLLLTLARSAVIIADLPELFGPVTAPKTPPSFTTRSSEASVVACTSVQTAQADWLAGVVEGGNASAT